MVITIVRVNQDCELLLKLAQESLYYRDKEQNEFIYSDNGNFEAIVFFHDLCDANATKLRKEREKHLKR